MSEFGLQFVRELPEQLLEMGEEEEGRDKENVSISPQVLLRRGQGVDFSAFANQTQTLLKRQSASLQRMNAGGVGSSESQRKLQLHHEQWLSEQRLLSHKLAETRARVEQAKYSEYDWRGVGVALRERGGAILGEWGEGEAGRAVRTRGKLKRLLVRKYQRP